MRIHAISFGRYLPACLFESMVFVEKSTLLLFRSIPFIKE